MAPTPGFQIFIHTCGGKISKTTSTAGIPCIIVHYCPQNNTHNYSHEGELTCARFVSKV